MRHTLRFFLPFLFAATFTVAPSTGHAQIIDIIQQAIIAAIEAADVAVQKAQNAVIDLQNAEKTIENDLSQTQLGQIANWTGQQKDLYANYFTELWKVKTIITDFQKITAIIAGQAQLVAEYKTAYAQVRQDKHFSPSEVTYIYNVLTGIVNQSIQNIDQITQLLESFTFQMSDADRMRLIQHASSNIQGQIGNLRAFNNQNAALSLQRSTDLNDLNAVKQLYGLP
jgi:predicted transcriptional regulator YheO